tara:strand:- start:1071 stop:1424 length:354 start_codon:yes stop_codon:yes gene_type:complete
MEAFQTIVLIVAISILSLCLIFIGVALYYHKDAEKYPPVQASCPDYWLDISDKYDDGHVHCKNIHGLGKGCTQSGKNEIMSFTSSKWLGNHGTCNKRKWARHCDLTWDGVTNSSLTC